MKTYIRLARPTHWIKNLLVLLPLLCSGLFTEWWRLSRGLWAFLGFSLLASSIYIINDIRDHERDRLNPAKCHRPIASGEISIPQALMFFALLMALALFSGYMANGLDPVPWAMMGAYFLLNLGYSFGLKKYPLVDVAILVSGFLLRMLYGGAVTEIALSKWLCLTVISMSFYLGLGKRRGELLNHDKQGQRDVLKYYTEGFLDKNMYMCVALTIVFYSLWTVDAMTVARVGSENLIWTVPLVILICMRYSHNVEGESDGDPVEVLLHDKLLMGLTALTGLIVFSIIYLS